MTTPADAFNAYSTAASHGVAVLEHVHGKKVHHFPQLDPAEARLLINTAGVLFGTTRFRAKQREAVEAAKTTRLSVSVLKMINNHLRKITEGADLWRAWIELASMKASALKIQARAKELVSELRTVAERTRGLSIRYGTDGMGTINFTGPQRFVSDLANSLEPLLDKDLKLREAQGKAFQEMLSNGGGVQEAAMVINVSVSIENLRKIHAGTGDEVTLTCDDGSTMTGAEYLQRCLDADHKLVLVSPEHGAINRYRLSRFANTKQRALLFVESPVCAHPGCSVPARRCQPHHVESWHNGGNTNMDNLVLLCPFHNGRNDDNPERRLHGRMIKIKGKAYWLPPWQGAKPQLNNHRLAQLSVLRQ